MILAKQSVGIDMAKLTFTACVCKQSLNYEQGLILSEVRKFQNTKTGFNQFFKWVSKSIDKNFWTRGLGILTTRSSLWTICLK